METEYIRGYRTGYLEQIEGGGTARALAEAQAQEAVDALEGYPNEAAGRYWIGYYHGRYHARTGEPPEGAKWHSN